MAEWSNAAVLKTVEGHTSGGSNPSFSAKENPQRKLWVFYFKARQKFIFVRALAIWVLDSQYLFSVFFWRIAGFSLKNGVKMRL